MRCNSNYLKCRYYLDPLVVGECGPDVMGLRDSGLVRLQNDLGPVVVHVQGTQDQDQPRTASHPFYLLLIINWYA